MRDFSPYELNQLQRYGLDPQRYLTDQRPVEYLTGHVQFRNLDLLVSPAVLIPRVETEELVAIALGVAHKLSTHLQRPLRAADVGCGSGAIGLSLAADPRTPKLFQVITLSDVSAEALSVAEQNLERLQPKTTQIELLQSNLLEKFPEAKKLDLIIANLPYIPSKNIVSLDASVKDFEPHLALDGGEDGLQIIAQLLTQLADHISTPCCLLLEIDDTHTVDDLKQLAVTYLPQNLSWHITGHADSFGQVRFIQLDFS